MYFDVNKNKLSAILKSEGFGKKININTKIKSKIDLKTLSDALQIPDLKLLEILTQILFPKEFTMQKKKNFQLLKDILIVTNGSLKTTYYPKPIEKINIKADLNCPTTDFKDAYFDTFSSNF